MAQGKRKFLIVHAHPLRDSLAAALRNAVVEGIETSGHAADLADLYADGLAAALSADERAAFVKPGYAPPPDVSDYCERLRAADGIVFVFPQWWLGMPAILKGFVDRVFVPGVAFDVNRGGKGYVPLLDNLRSFHVVTTVGSPWWVVELVMRNPVRRQIRSGIVRFCARRASFRMHCMYDLNNATRERCEKFIRRVRSEFSEL